MRRRERAGMSAPDAADAATSASADDPLPEALALAEGAAGAGLGLKLLGGLAVRVLCPSTRPGCAVTRTSTSRACPRSARRSRPTWRRAAASRTARFNNLNGDRQMYFTAPSGRPIDVMVDRLTMCHTLDLRPVVRPPAAHRRRDRRAAVQAPDRRAQREGRARHRAPAGRPCRWAVRACCAGHRPLSPSCWARTGAGGGPSPATWPSCPASSRRSPS